MVCGRTSRTTTCACGAVICHPENGTGALGRCYRAHLTAAKVLAPNGIATDVLGRDSKETEPTAPEGQDAVAAGRTDGPAHPRGACAAEGTHTIRARKRPRAADAHYQGDPAAPPRGRKRARVKEDNGDRKSGEEESESGRG
jgi:hypothetical protein